MGPRSVDSLAPAGNGNGSLRAAPVGSLRAPRVGSLRAAPVGSLRAPRVSSLRAAQRMSGCAPSPLAPTPLAPTRRRPYALRPYAGARPANCR